MWSVELWSVDPHEEGVELDDQLISDAEFETREEALECFLRPQDFFAPGVLKYAVFVAFDWDEAYDSRRIMSEEDEKKLRSLQECERRLDEAMERSEAGDVDPTPEVDNFYPCGDRECPTCEINCPHGEEGN